MFHSILIANRGEIACRIIRTAKQLGIKTIAVYSEADQNAMHVDAADEAWLLGPAPAKDSYLNSQKILEIAQASKAEAIHPGYGFLSENADFARQCDALGICFIGPPAQAIDAMGSKSDAKNIMQEAQVPLVPGYHGDNQDADFLEKEAEKIGYPLIIKATAGGGGKGMRIVKKASDFAEALTSCRRESLSSFKDDKVLIEKYLTKPRHVEIQVFCDKQGHGVHLFERDCSVQRRHQKVIEEAPAPNMSESLRQEMGQVAITAAKAIQYEGAGTVEFLLDMEDNAFYFMEMNTRLQVEHPVTEMITKQDLVEWQISVAAGNPLPLTQEALSISGHAFEARIYAEDPDQDFLPATGTLTHLSEPQSHTHVRIDSAVRQNDSISIHYDPMIAKLIVWDTHRDSALKRLQQALNQYVITGVKTNIQFLKQLAHHQAFKAADLDTHFIERYATDLLKAHPAPDQRIFAIAALHVFLTLKKQVHNAKTKAPWQAINGWRLNDTYRHTLYFSSSCSDTLGNSDLTAVTLNMMDDHYHIQVNNEDFTASGHLDEHQLRYVLNGTQANAQIIQEQQQLHIYIDTDYYTLTIFQEDFEHDAQNQDHQLVAPMPGTIIDVMVNPGDSVTQGQALIVMEAMKMEHTIKAPSDGVISEVLFQQGELVQEGIELIIFAHDETE